jgi:hypothetical protein
MNSLHEDQRAYLDLKSIYIYRIEKVVQKSKHII